MVRPMLCWKGHADERGTREYNLALGERRAETVTLLTVFGVTSQQIETVSYGVKNVGWFRA